MITIYEFDYNCGEAEVSFEVDKSIFKKEDAQELLDFFSWDYDKKADPIFEILKKYALRAIKVATANNYNEYGVKNWFAEQEGYLSLDGKHGVKLLHVEAYEFDEELLDETIKE